jgi:hypothetical protein
MKSIILLFAFISLLASGKANAQGNEFGLSLGLSTFFGDLGGANNIGRPLFFDFESSEVRPVVSLVYRYSLSKYFASKLMVSYTVIGADDKLLSPGAVGEPEWFRWYRNLNFRSHIIEGAFMMEVNLLRFSPGYRKTPFTPYLMGGVGVFNFNPKGYYNGQWVELQPLRTEGQGFPGYPDRQLYKLTQVCFPVGFGVRWNVGKNFIMGYEYGDRITLTDYVDDVSTSYVAQADFDAFFAGDPATAALAYDLSVQSEGVDPDGSYSNITAPGQQRGDPNDLDQYIFTGVISLTYFLGEGAPFWPTRVRSSFDCVKSWKNKR